MKKTVVLATGVFDILHEEHITFLRKAKGTGTYLIVGVESDKRVRELKGSTRPINPQSLRVENLEKLQIADEVFVLPEEFNLPEHHKALLQKIKPDVLAVSANTPHLEKKARLMQEIGGRLTVVHEYNPLVSTSQIIAEQAKQLSGQQTL